MSHFMMNELWFSGQGGTSEASQRSLVESPEGGGRNVEGLPLAEQILFSVLGQTFSACWGPLWGDSYNYGKLDANVQDLFGSS